MIAEEGSKALRILLTNDDGIDAEGLHLLEELALGISQDVTVVAPASNQSGTGRSISLHRDIDFHQRDKTHYSVGGTPADCVMLALHLLFPDKKPDLILSGINHGMNVADDIGYSGTVGAAKEAAINGIAGIALSQRFSNGRSDFTPVREAGKQVLKAAIDIVMPARTVLNINFPPAEFGRVKGIRAAHLDCHKFSDEVIAGDEPGSYRIGPMVMLEEVAENTDRWWLDRGYVSFTPLKMDMTAQNLLSQMPEKDFS